ncbi:MAG: tetratricopeptide (TPR) repeat protein [Halocynthiibacter sp.]|jgi:tetratricopeptide (TPR) repeat protein
MKTFAFVTAGALAVGLATSAFAAGGGDTPPKPTKTMTECKTGEVWDEKTKTCLKKEARALTDDQRYGAVRELAYAGEYDRAIAMIDSAQDQTAPRMLTYRGFTARKLGKMDAAMAFYQSALEADPDFILARSYMGQGLMAAGDLAGALAQLREIEARGGRETWAYAALDQALRGIPTNY